MRAVTLLACLTLLVVPLAAQANEKTKAQGLLDASRAAIEAFAKKNDDNKAVAGDIGSARGYLKKGEEALAGGGTLFGLGDITQEAGQDVKFDTGMAELYLVLGQSRIDNAKAGEELKVMKEQVARMKAKVKVFDDRKAELEKLRAEVGKFDATLKELKTVKEENTQLADKAAKLEQEKKALQSEVERLKGELAKMEAAASVVAAQAAAGASATVVAPPAASALQAPAPASAPAAPAPATSAPASAPAPAAQPAAPAPPETTK